MVKIRFTSTDLWLTLLIIVVAFLFSHMTTDRDMPKNMRTVAWVVFIILSLLYLIFGVIVAGKVG